MTLKIRSLSLNLPFGLGGVEMDVSEAEARAAWQLYVEIATRIVGQPLESKVGAPREALTSIYSLFGTTREVLRSAGPEVAATDRSLGPIAIRILNEGIRPFLLAWHLELREGESTPDGNLRPARQDAFDAELAELRRQIAEYSEVLARIAGIHT